MFFFNRINCIFNSRFRNIALANGNTSTLNLNQYWKGLFDFECYHLCYQQLILPGNGTSNHFVILD